MRSPRNPVRFRPRPLPPRPQDLQELRGEHHVAVLLARAEGNAQDHPLTIDRRRGEPDGFRDPQARGVTRRQDRAVLREGDAVEKLDHFRGAEHHRQGLRLLWRGDHRLDPPRLLERDCVEKPEGRHRDANGAGGQLPVVGQVDLVGPDLLGTQGVRRLPEVPSEPGDTLHVCPLGMRRELPHLHVFEQASSKDCHGTLLCEGAWGIPGVCKAAYGEENGSPAG